MNVVRPHAALRTAALSATLGLPWCHDGSIADLGALDPGSYEVPLCDHPAAHCDRKISLTYLGVGGWVLRSGSSAIMTAPMFSNPSMVRVVAHAPISTDERVVDSVFMASINTTDVRTILVGHSHYNHLMDIPHVATVELPDARVVGTPSMKHVLAAAPGFDASRAIALKYETVGAGPAKNWYYVPEASGHPRMRILAVASTHAPNFLGRTIAADTPSVDLTSLPRDAWQWPLGEIYSYVIDVIRADSTPAFRIFYQDAASDSAHSGVPLFSQRDSRPVDVAIVCAGNFDETPAYPTVLLNRLKPRWALVGHWEDFFQSPSSPLNIILNLDTRTLAGRMKDAQDIAWSTLRPFSTMTFVHSP